MSDWGIYGAYGYSGHLAARRAVELGQQPILLGRDEARLGEIAERLELPSVVVGLDDPKPLRDALSGVSAVLHCAGPFEDTAEPMVEACLATETSYLDITGETAVLEYLASRDQDAKQAGTVILPAVGFDVVPSDCLAVHVSQQLPAASSLTIAFDANTPPSHGTASTALRSMSGARIRAEGRLVEVPVASKQLRVDFGFDRGEAVTSLINWGDLSTAYMSTGIENIETYSALPPDLVRTLKAGRFLAPLIRIPALRSMAVKSLTEGKLGPDEAEREGKSSWLYASVRSQEGRSVAARLRVPHAYTLTALASVEATTRVVARQVEPGFQTPATAFGPDFILEFEGVSREDVTPSSRA